MAYVAGDFKPINAAGGISKGPGHARHRARCVQKFHSLFGDILSTSSAALMPSVQAEAWMENAMDLPEKWRPVGSPWAEGKTYSDSRLLRP